MGAGNSANAAWFPCPDIGSPGAEAPISDVDRLDPTLHRSAERPRSFSDIRYLARGAGVPLVVGAFSGIHAMAERSYL
jgi:hypothetical protein